MITVTASDLREILEGEPLTDREQQVLELIAQGYTDKEIAEEVYLAPETIKSYRKQIVAKLGAKNSAHAVALGIGTGYVNIETIVG